MRAATAFAPPAAAPPAPLAAQAAQPTRSEQPHSPPQSTLPRHTALIAIGGSAGGVDALLRLLGGLPADFHLPIVVVLHVPDDRASHLAGVFARRLAMPVVEARSGAPLARGTVHFAPAGYHLLVDPGPRLALSCDPPVMWSRPSIDVLMDSAAHALGPRLAAVLVTGASADGAAGLACVQAMGGFTAVQDPREARASTMPQAALDRITPDRVLPLAGLHHLLLDLNQATPCRT